MDSPQINVIGSSNTVGSSGPKFSFSPKVAILATVLLAVLAVAGAWLLLRAPKTQFAPAPSHASTTATISDDFSAATIDTSKWSTSQAPGTNPGSQGSGTYNSLIGPSASDSGVWNALVYNQTVSGDFNVQVDIPNFTPSPVSGTVAYAGIKMWQDANNAVIARRFVDQTGNFVDLYVVDNGTVTDGQNVAVPDGSTVTLRLARIGNIVQMFAKIGANSETLIGSSTVQMAGPYQIQLISGLNPGQPQSTLSSSYDNFSGQVNLVGLPSPTPGTAAACALTFNVLSTVPTPTPFPTPTPTGNPTPTPTPTGNPTPTPTPTPTPASTPSATPNSCNGTCGSNANCADGMVCDLTSGRCRNVSCLTSTNCTCASATPTPVASGPTPTPVTQLQQAGSVTGTWIITLSGAAMLILGAIVAFAL